MAGAIVGEQQAAPQDGLIVDRVGQHRLIGIAQDFRRRDPRPGLILQLEHPEDLGMALQHRFELLGARRLGNIAVQVDPDRARLPCSKPFQQFGELVAPILEKAGIPPVAPKVYPVHNFATQ